MVHCQHMKKHSGFTLVELLVVISIIALLSVVAFYAVTYVKARARDAKRVADLDTFSKALELYNNNTGIYPINTAGVCLTGTDVVSTALQTAGDITSVVKEPFYTDAPHCFSYSTDATGATYHITFYLETTAVGSIGQNTRP